VYRSRASREAGGFMKTLIGTATVLMLLAACQTQQDSTEASTTETVVQQTTETAEAYATDTTPAAATTPPTIAKETEKPMSEYKDKVADLNTSKGKISIRFFPDVAPNHVKNFIDLSEQGFYTGTRFHRVVPGFVIQGGDPNTKSDDRRAMWGTGGSGKNLKAEFNRIHHRRGILSMARSQDPDSASSQFFIVVGDAGFLDNQYTVFGEVTQGMDVVDTIVAAPKRGESPVEPVKIESVTVRAATEKEKGPTPK
jgi:peptidyl-prolyl cis-trans isomerase B (cyclophilin B)